MIRLRFLVLFAKGNNPTWDQASVVDWSNIEINVGIMCTCLPTVRALLTRAFPKVLETTRGSSQSSSGEGFAHKMQRLEESSLTNKKFALLSRDRDVYGDFVHPTAADGSR